MQNNSKVGDNKHEEVFCENLVRRLCNVEEEVLYE